MRSPFGVNYGSRGRVRCPSVDPLNPDGNVAASKSSEMFQEPTLALLREAGFPQAVCPHGEMLWAAEQAGESRHA